MQDLATAVAAVRETLTSALALPASLGAHLASVEALRDTVLAGPAHAAEQCRRLDEWHGRAVVDLARDVASLKATVAAKAAGHDAALAQQLDRAIQGLRGYAHARGFAQIFVSASCPLSAAEVLEAHGRVEACLRTMAQWVCAPVVPCVKERACVALKDGVGAAMAPLARVINDQPGQHCARACVWVCVCVCVCVCSAATVREALAPSLGDTLHLGNLLTFLQYNRIGVQ